MCRVTRRRSRGTRGACWTRAIGWSRCARSIFSPTPRTWKRWRGSPGLDPRAPPFDKASEQSRKLAGAPEVLGVPLHADAERRVRALDRLDDPIRRPRRGDEARRDASRRLMVPAVDRAGLEIGGRSKRLRELRAALDPDRMRAVILRDLD